MIYGSVGVSNITNGSKTQGTTIIINGYQATKINKFVPHKRGACETININRNWVKSIQSRVKSYPPGWKYIDLDLLPISREKIVCLEDRSKT